MKDKGTKKRANKQSLFSASAKYLLDYYHKGTKKQANKQSFQFTTNKKYFYGLVKVLFIHRYENRLFFPPILAVMEDDALSTLTLALLEEGNLVSYAKFYVFGNVEMSLTGGLQV